MANLVALLRRVRMLFQKRQWDRELRDEMQLHLELLHTRFKAEGFSDAEAVRAARRRFGAVLRLREASADAWGWTWLAQLRQDLTFGARILWRTPRFTMTALSILALGAGFNLSIFHLMNAVYFHRFAVSDADALVQMDRPVPFGVFSYYSEHSTRFSYLVSETSRGAQVFVDERMEPARSNFVSGNYFNALKVTAAHGRLIQPADASAGALPVVLLGYSYWVAHFGSDPSVIGRGVRVNGKPAQIIGVAPADFDGLLVGFQGLIELWFPVTMRPSIVENSPSLSDVILPDSAVYGKLKPDVALAVGQAELNMLTDALPQQRPEIPRATTNIRLEPLTGSGARFEADVALLIALVLLIFLSACANLGNLLLARGVVRQRELDIRRAVGAGQWRIVRQLMTENLLLALVGTAIGATAGYFTAKWFIAVGDLPPGVHIVTDWRIISGAAVTVFLSVLAFGLTPALRAVRGGRSTTRARQLLVAVQVAVGCVLLILSALLARSANRLLARDILVKYRQILVVNPHFGRPGFSAPAAAAALQEMNDRLVALPGVAAVTIAGGLNVPARYAGLPPVSLSVVTPEYFAVTDLPLVRGRLFRSAEANALVVSESAARVMWPNEDPIGKMVDAKLTVVGVVKDTGLSASSDTGGVEAYEPFSHRDLSNAIVMVRTRAAPSALIRSVLSASSVQGATPSIASMEAKLALDADPGNGSRMVAALGIGATLLAFTGIFGLTAFAVAQRTREIGVRIALGAGRIDILRTLLAQYSTGVGFGMAVGAVLAIAGAMVLRSHLFGLSPIDPVSYAGGLMTFLLAAVAAILIPARRALSIDPAWALRWE